MPEPPLFADKRMAIALLLVAEVAVLSLWFSSAAVLAEMGRETGVSAARLAWLSTAVQIGFGMGALVYAALGLADRFDPRRVFFASALLAAAANLALLALPVGGGMAVAMRAATGFFIAGVYPVGMKIAAGWGRTDRAWLISLLVGALTIGSASPHLIALAGGADWRATILATTGLAALGAFAILAVGLGPHHARAQRLDLGALGLVWTNRRIRLAVLGYVGHMWELYAFWAWVGVFAALSYERSGVTEASDLAKLTAFLAIALGGLACAPAGWLADRFGRATVAMACLAASGSAALLSAALFGGPAWVMMTVLVFWGLAIVPDSALYSTLVADAAPPERAGSLLTLQNALGFLLTAGTVQAAPALAAIIGWPWVLAALALGPATGIHALQRLGRPRG